MIEKCPDNLVNLMLEAMPSPQQQASLEDHIANCESCRQRLEENCGDQQFWNDLSTLSDDPFDTDWKNAHGPESRFPGTAATTEPSENTTGNKSRLHRLLETLKPLLAPSDDPASAGRIGHYEVMGIVGSGGMGIVLKAREPALDRIVAIKVLLPHLAADDACRIRFQREARAAAAIKHPGIIPIYRVDIFGDLPYFVMPFEVGPSLQDRIQCEGPLTIEESLRVASQISDALSAAHQSGLVHRDIKPSNILLAPGTERALLTDFGLAQTANDHSLTVTGVLAGTPPFMSPEQARGEAVDHRSDLFSLGSVLFSMLHGHPPFRDQSTYQLVRRIGDESMPKLNASGSGFPHWLEILVSKLHCQAPTDRIQSASDCAVLINQCIAHHQNPSANPLPPELRTAHHGNDWTWPRISLWVTAALLFAAIGWIGYELLNTQQPDPAEKEPHVNQIQDSLGNTPKDEDVKRDQSNHGSGGWDDGLDEQVREIRKRLSALGTD